MLPTTRRKGIALLVITRIPTHRNDGAQISAAARREILRQVRDTSSYRLEVLIEPGQLQVARELVIGIGKQLGQRAMYFEVRAGGEVIDIT